MRLIALAVCLLFAWSAECTTYFVDYSAGNDANAGTAKATAWKRAPGMKGATMAYSHAAGDRFYFKGGVTWPASCHQWKITKAGTSAAWDYYGADITWFSGASFTRPLFDCEQVLLGTWMAGAGVLVELPASYIIFDNLEFANNRAPYNSQGAWGSAAICLNTINSFTLTNCVVRDWMQANTAGVIPDTESAGAGIIGVNGASNLRVTHCTFTQEGSPTKNGGAVWSINTVDHTEMHHCATAMIYSGHTDASYNHIHHLLTVSDARSHANAMMFGTSAPSIHHNWIHDLAPGAMGIFPAPSFFTTATETPRLVKIWDNVIYNTAQSPIELDSRYNLHPDSEWHVYNNTIKGVTGSGVCIRMGVTSGGYAAGKFYFKNNHFITSANPLLKELTPIVLDLSNNLTNTLAAANGYGYTEANIYTPTDGSDPTVGTGTNLSSHFTTDYNDLTRSVPWDIGAYEWNGTGGLPGNLSFDVADYATTEDTTLTVNVIRIGGSTGTVGASYATADGTAEAGTDYTAASSTVSLGNGVTATTFNVTILRNVAYTGNRFFTIALSSATGGAALISPTTITVTIQDTDPEPAVIPTLGLAFDAADMLLIPPFTNDAGVVYSPVFSSTTNGAGQLQANCTFADADSYTLRILTDCPTDGANSFWVRVDGTNDVCDIIPLTIGNELREVNWRDGGTYDAPNKQPAQFTFEAASTHLLVIYGREAGAKITSLEWVPSAPPPPAQQINFAFSTRLVIRQRQHYRTIRCAGRNRWLRDGRLCDIGRDGFGW